jgi:hypothetical protein
MAQREKDPTAELGHEAWFDAPQSDTAPVPLSFDDDLEPAVKAPSDRTAVVSYDAVIGRTDPKRDRRIVWIAGGLAIVGVAAAIVLLVVPTHHEAKAASATPAPAPAAKPAATATAPAPIVAPAHPPEVTPIAANTPTPAPAPSPADDPPPQQHARVARPTIAVAPTPTGGVLMLASKPPCAIEIDGRATGLFTPQRSLNLTAGAHTVTLTNKQFHIRHTQTVRVVSGSPTKLIVDLTDEMK